MRLSMCFVLSSMLVASATQAAPLIDRDGLPVQGALEARAALAANDGLSSQMMEEKRMLPLPDKPKHLLNTARPRPQNDISKQSVRLPKRDVAVDSVGQEPEERDIIRLMYDHLEGTKRRILPIRRD